MKRLAAVTLTAVLLGAGGCKPAVSTASTTATAPTVVAPPSATGTMQTAPIANAPPSYTPEQLGEIGAAIKKEPKKGEQILAEHGLTTADFDKQIRAVTQNADFSKRYSNAFKKAGKVGRG